MRDSEYRLGRGWTGELAQLVLWGSAAYVDNPGGWAASHGSGMWLGLAGCCSEASVRPSGRFRPRVTCSPPTRSPAVPCVRLADSVEGLREAEIGNFSATVGGLRCCCGRCARSRALCWQ